MLRLWKISTTDHSGLKLNAKRGNLLKRQEIALQGMKIPGDTLVRILSSTDWPRKSHGSFHPGVIFCSTIPRDIHISMILMRSSSKSCRKRVWRSEIEITVDDNDKGANVLRKRQAKRDRCRCPLNTRPDDE